MRFETDRRFQVEFELVEAKYKLRQAESSLTEIESNFHESEKMVAELVTKLADAESRFANAESQLGNFELLYEVISQFLDFKELKKDLEYSGLNYAVQWLKNYAPDVNSDQLVSMFDQDWERTIRRPKIKLLNSDNLVQSTLSPQLKSNRARIMSFRVGWIK